MKDFKQTMMEALRRLYPLDLNTESLLNLSKVSVEKI